jgi:hypothetical protein
MFLVLMPNLAGGIRSRMSLPVIDAVILCVDFMHCSNFQAFNP